jgi:hypothetical protein
MPHREWRIMTQTGTAGRLALIALAIGLATLPRVAQSQENKPMSDQSAPARPQGEAPSVEAEVSKALAVYDGSHDASDLRHATDLLIEQDGEAPADPAAAAAMGQERLRLWLAVFERFRRDVAPDFDPNKPPPLKPPPPIIDGKPVAPWIEAKDIEDPVKRQDFERQLQEGYAQGQRFQTMVALSDLRASTRERAVESLRDARHLLGLTPADIETGLRQADIAQSDREALGQAATP